MPEPKSCPKCNKKMIKRTSNRVRLSAPPQYYYYWWCGCGYTEEIGWKHSKTEEQIVKEEWEEINK